MLLSHLCRLFSRKGTEKKMSFSLEKEILLQDGYKFSPNIRLVTPLFSSVQSLSRVQLFAAPWTAAHQAPLSITNSWSPPKPMSIESEMPSNHLILCRPFLLLPSIFPNIRVFQMSQLLASGGQSIGVSASTQFFQRTSRTDLLQNGLVGSPCSPRDSQKSA